jgi:hypothetical protein
VALAEIAVVSYHSSWALSQRIFELQQVSKTGITRDNPFLSKGSSKTPFKPFGENPCKKTFYKKVEGGNFFFLSLFSCDFFIAFLAVSLHEKLKNTIQICPKVKPERKSQKISKKGR